MEHEFDQAYWDDHWQRVRAEATARGELPPNPYLVTEVADLAPGTALEAGCGDGVEARWLARAGWRVTAADIAQEPLARAAARAEAECLVERVRWVTADLSTWEPELAFDLVTTHYAHADQQPPPEASVTAASITERFDPTAWEVATADELSRTVPRPDGSQSTLHDVVVRVVRR